ncbi:MAG TPA: PQQ-binding-like beta-propeller repeat protein [Vicinamibacterales bacterium]|nr:PQQ-binding-like beta-propeller repeat protein [Vicinamibacterales bacterium]
MRDRFLRAGVISLVASALAISVMAQRPAPAAARGDWPSYRGGPAGIGYSSLDQIGSGNVARLARAWTLTLQADPAPGAGPGAAPANVNSQATPIVIAGRMYLPTADAVVALDADTGRQAWKSPIPGVPSRRGVAYWPGDQATGPRIFVMSGRRLVALDAGTGAAAAAFGSGGSVDVGVPYNSVPGVFRNVVVIGANNPPGAAGAIGNPRAYDARSGAKLWEFSSVAQPGTPGNETWESESWKGRLGANAWPFYFTFDEQRGLLYVPLASPIPGGFGGDRKGANLFGNSVVALDVQTGAYKWHFQTIHHDLWDHDPPAPPALFDVTRNGGTVPALGLTTKSGYLYILNRETGAPIFGVEERAMPKSDVPGELAFPTQPIPVKPPPLARVAYTAADLVTATDTTPEHARACAELVAQMGGVTNDGPFTPWRLKPTLVFPGTLGGANWGGAAYDPASGYIIVATQDLGALGVMAPAKAGSPLPYERVPPGRGTFDARIGDTSWPCQKPPWGRLTAVHASTGDIAWQIPLGVTDQLPAGRQQTGRPVLAGAITTASGLLFIASTDDNRFRALDVKSGRELWVERLARRGNADPMTYLGRDGKQRVAVVSTDTLVVYAVP